MKNSENKSKQNFKITGDWGKQIKIIRKILPQLTIADLKFERGKEEELIDRIGKRLDKNKSEVIAIIREALPDADY